MEGDREKEGGGERGRAEGSVEAGARQTEREREEGERDR